MLEARAREGLFGLGVQLMIFTPVGQLLTVTLQGAALAVAYR